MDTKINLKLSQLGYNYLRDIYSDVNILTQGEINPKLSPFILRSLISVIQNIPAVIQNGISRNEQISIVILVPR